ncbi:transglutaminase family protein, partial [Candidatus Bathyarchaeota archaeon]
MNRYRTFKRNSNPRRNRATIVLILLLAPLVTYCYFYKCSLILTEIPARESFILTIKITMKNMNPEGKEWLISDEEKTISLFMNNTWQTVYILNTSHPIDEIYMDDDGNPVASLSLPNRILYGKNITYKVTYKIILKPRSLPAISEKQSGKLSDKELKEKYCKAEGPWQVDKEELRNLAFEIAGNETNILLLLEKFIRWIRDKIRYYHPEIPRYPNETVEYMSGDCDDQANLLITFCRIVGIPAYLQLGCIYIPQRD